MCELAAAGPSQRGGDGTLSSRMLTACTATARWIAGMGKGLPDFVCVNLCDLEKQYAVGEEVTLLSVEKFMSISGSDTKLPLKVRGRWG